MYNFLTSFVNVSEYKQNAIRLRGGLSQYIMYNFINPFVNVSEQPPNRNTASGSFIRGYIHA